MIQELILTDDWQLLTDRECVVHTREGRTYQITYIRDSSVPIRDSNYFEIGGEVLYNIDTNSLNNPCTWIRRSDKKTSANRIYYYEYDY